jgi:hypothetical protein
VTGDRHSRILARRLLGDKRRVTRRSQIDVKPSGGISHDGNGATMHV